MAANHPFKANVKLALDKLTELIAKVTSPVLAERPPARKGLEK